MKKEIRIPHTGKHSPIATLAGLQHYLTALIAMLARHPEQSAIVGSIVAGKATISPADTADGSAVIKY
jgi:hypothetical protein